MGERGQVGWFFMSIIFAALVAVALAIGFVKCVVPGDSERSLARTEVAARSHDHDGDNGDEEEGDGEVNYFSPKIDKLVICLPGSTCEKA